MSRIRILHSFAAFSLLTVLAAAALPANALQLDYVLTGPVLNGIIPSGRASIDQSRIPGMLKIEVQNVNLPDHTSLDVVIGFFRVGTLNISGGQAKMQTSIGFQVRADPVTVNVNGIAIMTARFK